MKAAVLFANQDIRYVDVPEPPCGPDEVKVHIRAAGICGSDIPRVLHNGAHFYPIILGHEFSGDIVEIGQNVTDLTIGDTVSGAPLLPCMRCADCQRGFYALCKHYSFIGSRQPGSFAQYVVLPARNAIPYDPAIPYAQAAMFEPSTVALHGLLLSDYRGGETVAILGCGTIGLFTLQWARLYGAKRIVAFDIDPGRLALARRMGADAVVNTAEPGFMDAAGAGAFGAVFETAGSPVTMRLAFELAGNKASVCFIGTPHEEVSFPPALFEKMNRKEFRLTGSWMSYSAPFPGREWTLTAEALRTGGLRFDDALIYKSLPLSKAAEAFALYQTPGQVHGKIMLTND